MSLSTSEMEDLWEYFGERNSSDPLGNISSGDVVLCATAFSRRALLSSMCVLYTFIFVVGLARDAGAAPRHETHVYVTQLAAADLCVCVTLPVWVSSLAQSGHWPFGEAACKLTHLLFSVNLFSSIFFLACMSVDRYLGVVGRGGRGAGAADGPAAARPSSCWASRSPFPVIAVFYALLARALSRSSQERCVSRRVILAYIVVFLGCWGPYHAVLLTDALSQLGVVPLTCGLENVLYVALHLTQCLSLFHCCFNPILYNFINRNYRYDLMKAFIFKYSTRTGLARLIDTSHVSEAEYSAVAVDSSPQV
uniref:G-protein coupled receptors family 1 profile domain-containing protein n=1 Tax=Gadus morhua TaxID=8049 RepID=A0A8C5BMM7_GADMO